MEFLVLADDRRRTVGELRQDQPDHLRPGDALLIAQLVYGVPAGVIEGLQGIVAVYVKRGRDVALSGLQGASEMRLRLRRRERRLSIRGGLDGRNFDEPVEAGRKAIIARIAIGGRPVEVASSPPSTKISPAPGAAPSRTVTNICRSG